MKRSVAITGNTPAFLRWAIWHPCDLRELDPYRFPDQTFRALRGVRELSVAKMERRCDDQFCFHPELIQIDTSVDAELVRGFSRQEITEAFGGESIVDKNCTACPANAGALSQPGLWAGCYGILPTHRFDFDRLLSGHPQTEPTDDEASFDLVKRLQQIAIANDLQAFVKENFGPGNIVWHQLWRNKILSVKKVAAAKLLFDQVRDSMPKNSMPISLVSFCNALAVCCENDFPLHTELVPAGFSDSQSWALNASCPVCSYEPAEIKKQQKCLGCGRVGGISAGPKFKVLGLRPYVHLSGIVGPDQTRQRAERLRNNR